MRERCIEAASMEYHTRRREVGGLFRHDPASGQRAERGDASPLHQRIDMFVRQQVLHPRGVAGAGLSMAMKLFQEIHSVRNTLAKALTARQNAKSETIPPSQGTFPSMFSSFLYSILCMLSFCRCKRRPWRRHTECTLRVSQVRETRISCRAIPPLPHGPSFIQGDSEARRLVASNPPTSYGPLSSAYGAGRLLHR